MSASEREQRRRRPALTTGSAAETEAAGAELAALLGPGDVVVLAGEVGAGKTTLIRGACRALGIEQPVTSPTFTVGQRYVDGRLPVAHLDLYRLEDLEAEDPALLDDYLGSDGVAFVEWPELAVPRLGERRILAVRLEHLGGDRRRIEMPAASARK
jgi:tRNA threonylcarbamoyladenosine biosynthesis protein TsaE